MSGTGVAGARTGAGAAGDTLDLALTIKPEVVIQATGAALGHAIERAVVIGQDEAAIRPKLRITGPEIAEVALQQFEFAREGAKQKLTEVQNTAATPEQSDVLGFQVMALDDPTLIPQIRDFIANGVPVKRLPAGTPVPEGATKVHVDPGTVIMVAFSRYIDTLRAAPDEYLSARAPDIEAVRDTLLSLLAGTSTPIDWVKAINEPCILVADKLTPGQSAAIKKDFIRAIATRNGTKNDHVAVIAKSLGIPLVVGVDTTRISTGATVLVDGDRGVVIVNPTTDSIRSARAEMEAVSRTRKKLPIGTRAPKTKDGEEVTIAATMDNIEQQDEIVKLRAQGVGLFRTEFMHLGKNQVLGEEEQFEKYSQILKALSPNPVVFRIMDLGADKVFLSASQHTETNPALGARGIRLALHKDQVNTILIPQIRAILRASVYGEARILIPMVNNVSEIGSVRQIIAAQSANLTSMAVQHDPNIKVGAMIETPAAALGAYRIFRAVDFANVGSNDMTQYTLALDRENPLVEHHYHPHDPSLIEIYRTIARANMAEARDAERNRRPLLVCGDASSNPLMLPIFIGLGYRGFSVPPPAVEELNYRLSLLDSKRCAALVDTLRDPKSGTDTAEAVLSHLNEFLSGLEIR